MNRIYPRRTFAELDTPEKRRVLMTYDDLAWQVSQNPRPGHGPLVSHYLNTGNYITGETLAPTRMLGRS